MTAPTTSPAPPSVLSYSGDLATWTLTRYHALLGLLQAQGIPNAENAAAAVVAHWAREVGWGRDEWAFNVGNIKASAGWHGAAQTLPDGRVYRAYPSLSAGVADTLALLESPAYSGAWSYLVATGDGGGWYDRLMHAGWHPWSQGALDEYASIHARVRRTVELPPVASTATGTPSHAGAMAAGGAVGLAALLAWRLWR